MRIEEPEEQERRKSGMWHVATGPCTGSDCELRIHFTPVIHFTAGELHSCPEVCEVPLISKVYDRYPKSVISSGNSTGAQKARKLSIFAQSQKWGWNNGRSKQRRKSRKNGTSESSTDVQKPRKLSIFCTEPEVRTE